MRPLETMLTPLSEFVATDPPRAEAAVRGRAAAADLARRFPLVHRTVKPGGRPLREIMARRRLSAGSPCTEREGRCGISRALYFFLGCGAFPEGTVAFLIRGAVLEQLAATYTPFDTGSLERHAGPRDQGPWDGPEKDAFLAAHLGAGPDAREFSAQYVAAHFRSPPDYVLRPQRSEPDFPTYHRLTSFSGDRRAWSIEVQVQDDVPLDPLHVEAIVLGQPDLIADIPDDLVSTVVVAEAEGAITPTIHRLVLEEQPS